MPCTTKKVKDGQAQIERHIKVEHEDADRRGHDLRRKVQIEHKFGAYRDRFNGMMTKMESMWDDYLGCMSVAKHLI